MAGGARQTLRAESRQAHRSQPGVGNPHRRLVRPLCGQCNDHRARRLARHDRNRPEHRHLHDQLGTHGSDARVRCGGARVRQGGRPVGSQAPLPVGPARCIDLCGAHRGCLERDDDDPLPHALGHRGLGHGSGGDGVHQPHVRARRTGASPRLLEFHDGGCTGARRGSRGTDRRIGGVACDLRRAGTAACTRIAGCVAFVARNGPSGEREVRPARFGGSRHRRHVAAARHQPRPLVGLDERAGARPSHRRCLGPVGLLPRRTLGRGTVVADALVANAQCRVPDAQSGVDQLRLHGWFLRRAAVVGKRSRLFDVAHRLADHRASAHVLDRCRSSEHHHPSHR